MTRSWRRIVTWLTLGLLWGLIVTASEISILPVEAMAWRDQLSVIVAVAAVYLCCGAFLGLTLGPIAPSLPSRFLIPVVFSLLVVANLIQVALTALFTQWGEGPTRMFGHAPDLLAVQLHGLWLHMFFGGLALVAYLLRRRADRTRTFIARAMIAVRHSEAAFADAEARALRNQVEPQRLVDYVNALRDRYQADLDQGDLLLERLTDYLRAAMPSVRHDGANPLAQGETIRRLRVLNAALSNHATEVSDHEVC